MLPSKAEMPPLPHSRARRPASSELRRLQSSTRPPNTRLCHSLSAVEFEGGLDELVHEELYAEVGDRPNDCGAKAVEEGTGTFLEHHLPQAIDHVAIHDRAAVGGQGW